MDDPKQLKVFDSDQQQVGETYATALIGFGQQNGSTETLLEQLGGVVDVLHGLPKLNAMLSSPGIAASEKMTLLDKAFRGRVDGGLLNFLKIVLDKGRFDCLAAIRNAGTRLFDELSGRVQAVITTAEPIDDGVRSRIEEKLAGLLGKQVQLASETNPAIIGGLVVRVGDTVYDASVQNQLNQVRVRASKRAADAIRSSIDKFMAG